MAAAHWFPWQRIFKRDLYRLEAYAIGTVAIVGTAALAIASSADGDQKDHSHMLLWAAGAAGVATAVGYTLDEFVRLRAENAGLKAERESLRDHV